MAGNLKGIDERLLVTELETASGEWAAMQSGFWQIFGFMVIIGLGSLVLLGRGEPHNISSVAFFTIAAILASGAVWLLVLMHRRLLWRQRVTWARIREIEAALGLRRHIWIDALDHFPSRQDRHYWQYLTEADDQTLKALYRHFRPPFMKIAEISEWFAALTTAAWVARILWEVTLAAGG